MTELPLSQGKVALIDDEAAELFALAQAGGDSNRIEAYERLRKMTPEELRRLRRALSLLDGLIDEAFFDRHLQRK